MWESGPWLPAYVSPDRLIWYWLALLAFVTLAFLFTAVAAASGLGSLKNGLNWRGPAPPLAGLAVLSQLSLSTLVVPVHGMTDAALVTAFARRVTEDFPATLIMEELQTRSNPRWSSFSDAVRALRSEPQRLSKLVFAARSEAMGYAGCSMPILTPTPYHGSPELDLLTVLVKRGELDEPRAWLSDPAVAEDLKAQLQRLLATAR